MKSAKQNTASPKSRRARSATTAPQKQLTRKKPTETTKHDTVIKLLRGNNGATIAAIAAVTSWQAHSIRGFLAGTVRKKLGLTLTSEKHEGERRYRVVNGGGITK